MAWFSYHQDWYLLARENCPLLLGGHRQPMLADKPQTPELDKTKETPEDHHYQEFKVDHHSDTPAKMAEKTNIKVENMALGT